MKIVIAAPLAKGAEYGHQGEQFAFMDWQPSDIFKTGQGLDPHSGNRVARGHFQTGADKGSLLQATGLIGPMLSGGHRPSASGLTTSTHRISHMVRRASMSLISNIDNQVASFPEGAGETHEQGDAKWNEVKVDVPEGTRYFAIHHNTSKDQAFVFMIDDITFESSWVLFHTTSIVMVNIYLTASSWRVVMLPLTEQKHNYSVTTVYA